MRTKQNLLEPPADLSAQEKILWETLLACIHNDPSQVLQVVLSLSSKNEQIHKRLLEDTRQFARNEASDCLSMCSTVISLTPEEVLKYFRLPTRELELLREASSVYQNRRLEISLEEIQEILNLATVKHVLEEEKKILIKSSPECDKEIDADMRARPFYDPYGDDDLKS